jgi:OOP family OmpA-OmpF porin
MPALRLVVISFMVLLAFGCASNGRPKCNLWGENQECGAPPPPPPPPPRPVAPAPAPPPPDTCGRIVLRGVNFAFDKSDIDSASAVVLDAAADQLKECPNVNVRVEGHTDSVGTDAYNQGLSERRAEAVRGHLVSRGVSASRLSAVGYGESQPVASNDTAEGRALNRRVELKAQ